MDSVHSKHGGQVHDLPDYTVKTSPALQPNLKYSSELANALIGLGVKHNYAVLKLTWFITGDIH